MSLNGTIAAMTTAPAVTYIVGLAAHDAYAQNTAELTAAALIDGGIPSLVIRDIASARSA